MTKLTETALRILSEMEEAGAENIPSTMNTVLELTGEQQDIDVFQEALQSLIDTDFVGIGYPQPQDGRLVTVQKDEALATVGHLPALVAFDEQTRYWQWDKTKPWAEIVVTSSGRLKAEEILEQRGYQWWRK